MIQPDSVGALALPVKDRKSNSSAVASVRKDGASSSSTEQQKEDSKKEEESDPGIYTIADFYKDGYVGSVPQSDSGSYNKLAYGSSTRIQVHLEYLSTEYFVMSA